MACQPEYLEELLEVAHQRGRPPERDLVYAPHELNCASDKQLACDWVLATTILNGKISVSLMCIKIELALACVRTHSVEHTRRRLENILSLRRLHAWKLIEPRVRI